MARGAAVNSKCLVRGTLFFFVSIFLSGISCAVYAAKASTLSLSQALSQALTHSPIAEQAQSQAAEASWKKVESYSGFLPSVSLTVDRLLDKKYFYTNLPFGGTIAIVPQIMPSTI